VKVAAALLLAAGVAHADPDPHAVESASEANLETKAPRAGTTFAAAIGGGLIISNGQTARVPTLSLRLGHVATASTVVFAELVGGTYAHKAAVMSDTRIDSQVSFLIGAQVYIAPSVWLRGGGGVGTHNVDDGTGITPHGGLSGVGGAGVDLVRWKYLVLGVEGFYTGTFAKGGYTSLGGLSLGLSYY
jgi:hypothetical protein